MTKNNISQLDTASGNNTTLDDIDISGATGKVKDGDNVMRSLAAMMAKFYDDFGAVVTVGGTGNAVTLTTSAIYTALATGLRLAFTAGAANTGAATLNLDSLGAKAIRKISGATDVALASGDIVEASRYELIYDATANSAAGAWVLLNPGHSEKQMAVVRVQTFTSSGTYTPHAKMLYCKVQAQGSGGGGGSVTGGATVIRGASGGGAGEYAEKVLSKATIGASQTVTIGAAGAGGTAAGNGGAGSATSLAALVVANGGGAGAGNNNTTVQSAGGAGGTGGTGDLLVPGQAGQVNFNAEIITVRPAPGGIGGLSVLGRPGAGNDLDSTAAANASTGYGAGGNGAHIRNSATTLAGGAGAAGILIVTEFCSE